MTGLISLLKKHLTESRWMLALSSVALFAFGWLGVFFVGFGQRQIRRMSQGGARPPGRLIESMSGEGATVTTGTMEVLFWIHPFVWLPIVVWAIARGSLSVAGELERGTMDLTLSRPISRSGYLGTQIAFGVFGLLVMVGSILAGNLVGTHYNVIDAPPSFYDLMWPSANFVALGCSIFGATLLLSSIDVVRWRSILIASTLTIGSYAAWIIGTVPALRGTNWETWLYRLSFFSAFNPVDAIGEGRFLSRNLEILFGIGIGGILLGLIAFNQRDLPANS